MFGSHPSRWIILLAFGALSALGCVGTTDTGPQGETGSLSVDLVLADGVEIDEVDWQITGNGMDMSGDIDVSAPGSTASVEVFGLPPGDEDYTVTLTATSTDEAVTCQGSAPFNVEIGKATDVMVMLNCKKPRTLGGVRVNGEFNICTQLTKVVVSPLQTSVGNDITLMSQAFDEEGDDIMYIWSGDGGSIADPSAANTTYTCQEVGEYMVTVLVTDNDVYCKMATWTVPVTCVEGEGDLCDGVECEDTGNECTAAECNPANGECETSNVDDGTECGDGGMCDNGECVAADLCLDVQCDECNACDPATGLCAPADEGADCGDGGTCTGGECIVVDLCDGVTCDDTGNECTVAMCNTQTGVCDTMNAPDGTECNGGAGVCSDGTCVDNNLCDDVDCTSGNECVQDGTCDPADGMCVPGANQPADTACGDGDVCDGQGNCVGCNNAGQCPDDSNGCTAASCADGTCGQSNLADGTMCDLQSVGDGVCMSGVCEAAPECTVAGDCDDGNECTAGDCVGGACEFVPTEGASCLVEIGVPGTCDNAGACIGLCDGANCTSSNQCVQDGSCDPADGECIPGANEPEGTTCDQDGGTACDGAGNCIADAPDDCGTSGDVTVQIGCTNGVTTAQSPFPNVLNVTVNEPVLASAAFTVDASGIGAFPKFFLDAAQSTVPGGVRSAIIEGFNTTVEAASGGTGSILLQADPSGITPGLVSFCQYPKSTVCTVDGDCIVPPCNTPVLVAEVPIAEDCGAGGVCEGLGQGFADGPTAQCNITDPPEFCVTGDLLIPLFAPGGPEVFTAGAGPGNVAFNWAVDPATSTCPGDSRCATDGGTLPDGSLVLPASIYGDPVNNPDSVGLNGIRLNVAGALFVALQGSAGQDGGECASGEGCRSDGDCLTAPCTGVGVDDDIIMPTDPATLPVCPIN